MTLDEYENLLIEKRGDDWKLRNCTFPQRREYMNRTGDILIGIWFDPETSAGQVMHSWYRDQNGTAQILGGLSKDKVGKL